METTVRRIGEALVALRDAWSMSWGDGAGRPAAWPDALWYWLVALAVLILLVAVRRRPRPLEIRPPQLLITQGEVVPDRTPDEEPRRRRTPTAADAGSLAMTVSNLSRYPVQLLEVGVREDGRGAPRVAEVEAVVPAMGSVDVTVRVPLALRGDGLLDLYCYAAAPRHKLHRHRAELVWEPWSGRFKVAPMEQVATPARRLPSEERGARFTEIPPTPEALPARPNLPPAAANRSAAGPASAGAGWAAAAAAPPATGRATRRPPPAARPVAAASGRTTVPIGHPAIVPYAVRLADPAPVPAAGAVEVAEVPERRPEAVPTARSMPAGEGRRLRIDPGFPVEVAAQAPEVSGRRVASEAPSPSPGDLWSRLPAPGAAAPEPPAPSPPAPSPPAPSPPAPSTPLSRGASVAGPNGSAGEGAIGLARPPAAPARVGGVAVAPTSAARPASAPRRRLEFPDDF